MAKKSSKGNGRPIPKIEINLELSPEQGEGVTQHLIVFRNPTVQSGIELLWKAVPDALEVSRAGEGL
jgi:hypothetical protein